MPSRYTDTLAVMPHAVNFAALPLPDISFEVRVPLCLPPCQARGRLWRKPDRRHRPWIRTEKLPRSARQHSPSEREPGRARSPPGARGNLEAPPVDVDPVAVHRRVCLDTATGPKWMRCRFSSPRRFTARDWALPGRALDVNLEGSYVHQYKLEISGYLILSGDIGYFYRPKNA